ncbi:MAG: sigma-70 family RNA polymerase sigma factor [Verrucomicrobiota bacterium]|jgi:RNA polymerase sigma factor (sigma-70 family)
MMTTEAMQTAEFNDADLVAESLGGNRDAFRQIVEKYQTLISSLAYCATGNMSQSEDLAQETFLSAWQELAKLREPAKLRPWLCSITRFLVSKYFRREGREPAYAAETLEAVFDWASPEPLPPDQVITEEEKAILWRSLERIPEIYREPLVLFYRQQQSIETVAHDLGLSEDAVKQRLSRGRKMLEEQVLAFVAGALKQTSPGKAFTIGVLAALPLLATSAKAATVTSATTKGGSAAKAASGAGTAGAFLTGGMMFLFSMFGVFGFVGRWFGRKMGRLSQQSALGRKRIIQFWRTLALGFLVLALPPTLVSSSMIHSHPWLFPAGTWSLSAFYWLVAAAWVIWVWQRKRDARRGETESPETTRTPSKAYNVWVTLGMSGPALIVGMFLYALFFSDWTLSSNYIPTAEAQRIITERKDAKFTVYQYRAGSKSLEINLPENHRVNLTTFLDASLLSALTEKGITYQTLIEDQDFHNGGVRGWLVLLSTFIVVAGVVLLLRRPGTKKYYQQEVATPRAEKREKNIAAVCAALALIAMGLMLVVFMIAHAAESVSAPEARKIISEHKNARFELEQYDDGSKDLWITLPGSRTYPGFISPADESTLALLVENKISYKTSIQGRDFGHRDPSRWMLLLGISVLVAGATYLLWRVVKENRTLPAPAESRV